MPSLILLIVSFCFLMLFTTNNRAEAFVPPTSRLLPHSYSTPLLASYSISPSSSSTRLFHMGHSHSHDHHQDDDPNLSTTKTISMTPAQKQQRQRRRIALWVFCWFATCGSSFLMKKSIAKSDWLAFGITSFVLSSADRIRRSFRKSIGKAARLKDGIIKHSPNSGGANGMNQALQDDAREADRVTWIGVAINLILSVGKLVVGVTQHSSVLVADAGHSLSDLVSDFITLWTVKVARLPADEDHPYGHWKFEAIGSLFLSLTLIATAFSVGSMANKQLMQTLSQSGASATIPPIIPGKLALVMAAISIASKEWLYRITKEVGERIRSQIVIANAWHHRSDAYSSVLALASIAWARTGVPAADAAAGLLVAGMIGMTGGEILMESVQQLSDGANPSLQKQCKEHCQDLLQQDPDDVLHVTSIKARQVGSLSLVEIQLTCPMHLSTTAARAVEERWKYWLKERYGYEATVHTKPDVVLGPILIKEEQSQSQSQQMSLPGLTSAGSIEFLARQQALLSCSGQVKRVTVHYHPGCQTSVDVMVSEPPQTHHVNTTGSSNDTTATNKMQLPDLVEQGQRLKDSLQELDEIDHANIYWDLSPMENTTTATTTTATATATAPAATTAKLN
jgi:cation diffusion facilitator family transporter